MLLHQVEDDVPESWEFLIDAFIDFAYELEESARDFQHLEHINFYKKYGTLRVSYGGGNKILDGAALMLSSISSKICGSCGALATRGVFGEPRCDECT